MLHIYSIITIEILIWLAKYLIIYYHPKYLILTNRGINKNLRIPQIFCKVMFISKVQIHCQSNTNIEFFTSNKMCVGNFNFLNLNLFCRYFIVFTIHMCLKSLLDSQNEIYRQNYFAYLLIFIINSHSNKLFCRQRKVLVGILSLFSFIIQ